MKGSRMNAPAVLLAAIWIAIALYVAYALRYAPTTQLWAVGACVLMALITVFAVQMAQQWEKAIVLRFGKLHCIRGPGLFLIVPVMDSVTEWIDERIQTTEFNAEQALTKDAVPANIDAILFGQVHNAQQAALEITDYRSAILRVAQTSLREMIGSSPLSALLADRKTADEQLRIEIGRKTADWGVSAVSVEIRDVTIPRDLQDAMSRQAQAEREKEARVTLGSAEELIAHKFLAAANIYARNPAALQLRAMNIVYETTKERGATILLPSAMVDCMNPGGLAGLAAIGMQKASEQPPATAGA